MRHQAGAQRQRMSARRGKNFLSLLSFVVVVCDNVTEKSFKQERQETHLAWLPDFWTFVHFFSLFDSLSRRA
jgi:hypothetical protein